MPPAATLLPVTEPDFPVLRDLAETIWREHYAGIIPAAQIDFMLAGRLADESLRAQLGSPRVWLQVNKRNTSAIAFYTAAGFAVFREAMFDIGSGFVMDDYLMAKPI